MNKFNFIFVVFVFCFTGLLHAFSCTPLQLKCGNGKTIQPLNCGPSTEISGTTRSGKRRPLCVPQALEGATLHTFEKLFDEKIETLCSGSNPLLDQKQFLDQYHQNKCDAKAWVKYFAQVG